MANKNDLRVIKNIKNINQAFLELIEKYDYEKITVTEIAERAMINRKTFYLHYETKDALLNEVVKGALVIMLENTRYSDLIPSEDCHMGSIKNDMFCILKNISSEKTLFKLLFTNHEMLEQTRALLKGRLIDFVIENVTINKNIPKDLFSISVTAVIIEMIRWWLGQEKYSVEETALMFTELLNNGFTQIVREEC